ncbi:hypothetical protein B0T26DRAFT_657548 [Lasiosphaeria miniovina]|uniref:Rhodopsin domain-containing protein n=1 Tax=Lasiosphaeria miniovina TaxID=1954250 RepID=A0AA40DI17_9PEZI|nr:uncharacterized protein B0T26DRAFT_657548 [Lasiosphaeria miniovina]KAK0703955.1 hypothetical protein B0T26DRAFT_657548 [Lasiosphaeria miniovina]
MRSTNYASARRAEDDGLPHNDLGPELNAIFWLLTSLSLAFVGLRIYCKLSRGRRLWWDDYMLIASWVCVSASTTSVCVALDYGKHGYDMRPENLPKMPFVAVFAGFFSVLAATLSKTSFALTLLRLSERWMRVAIWFIIVTLNAIMGTAMLFMWIKCKPVARIWDKSVDGTCISEKKIIYLFQWSAGYSGAMDVVLALFPTVILWKWTMSKRDKFGVIIAMSMGIVAGIASFVKCAMLPNLAGDPSRSPDTVAVTIWGSAEGAITIMAASLPVLRALIRGNSGAGSATPARLYVNDERRLTAGRSSETLEMPQLSPFPKTMELRSISPLTFMKA